MARWQAGYGGFEILVRSSIKLKHVKVTYPYCSARKVFIPAPGQKPLFERSAFEAGKWNSILYIIDILIILYIISYYLFDNTTYYYNFFDNVESSKIERETSHLIQFLFKQGNGKSIPFWLIMKQAKVNYPTPPVRLKKFKTPAPATPARQTHFERGHFE